MRQTRRRLPEAVLNPYFDIAGVKTMKNKIKHSWPKRPFGQHVNFHEKQLEHWVNGRSHWLGKHLPQRFLLQLLKEWRDIGPSSASQTDQALIQNFQTSVSYSDVDHGI